MIKQYTSVIDLQNPTVKVSLTDTNNLLLFVCEPLKLKVKNYTNVAPRIYCTTAEGIIYQDAPLAIQPIIYPIALGKNHVGDRETKWSWASDGVPASSSLRVGVKSVEQALNLAPYGNRVTVGQSSVPSNKRFVARNFYTFDVSQFGLPSEDTLNLAGEDGKLIEGFFPYQGGNLSAVDITLPAEDGSRTFIDIWNYFGSGGFETFTEIEQDYTNRNENILTSTTITTGATGLDATLNQSYRFPIPANSALPAGRFFGWGFPTPIKYYLCLDCNLSTGISGSNTATDDWSIRGAFIVGLKVVKLNG